MSTTKKKQGSKAAQRAKKTVAKKPVAKKSTPKKTVAPAAKAPTASSRRRRVTMSKTAKVFTHARHIMGDKDDKPNGLLFGSHTFITDDELTAIFTDPSVRALLPKGKPVMCIRYHKDPDTKNGFEAEWRVALSAFSHYTLPLSNDHITATMMWEEPDSKGQIEVKRAEFKDLMNGCKEMFRAVGCEECPHKGLECLTMQAGYRPWPFALPFSRKDAWANGLTDAGDFKERFDANKAFELQGADLPSIEASLSRLAPAGFQYVGPDQTRVNKTPLAEYPCRAPCDHRFFKATGKGAKSEE